jgi:hypothetical protein
MNRTNSRIKDYENKVLFILKKGNLVSSTNIFIEEKGNPDSLNIYKRETHEGS